MATYKVEKRDDRYYVVGLKDDLDLDDDPDTMLLYRYSYPYSETPDVDTRMKDAHMMYGALYDLLQTHDGIKDGDIFETEFGKFHAESFHLVADFDMGPDPRETKNEYA